jgi:hypothetical protein
MEAPSRNQTQLEVSMRGSAFEGANSKCCTRVYWQALSVAKVNPRGNPRRTSQRKTGIFLWYLASSCLNRNNAYDRILHRTLVNS